jgi:hypothetical protein
MKRKKDDSFRRQFSAYRKTFPMTATKTLTVQSSSPEKTESTRTEAGPVPTAQVFRRRRWSALAAKTFDMVFCSIFLIFVCPELVLAQTIVFQKEENWTHL